MLNLLAQLTLEQKSDTQFIGPASNELHIRSFGGQIIAQSLMAVGMTVNADRPLHSLHGYFLRPGNTDKPMQFDVDRVRDGRSFSMRRVDVNQNDRTMFTMMASFHLPERGAEHSASMPDVTAPDKLQSFDERFGHRSDMGRWFARTESYDLRFVDATPFEADHEQTAHSRLWVRFKEPLGDSSLLHRAVIAYLSDLSILDPILLAHGRLWTESAMIGASLDHSMWFHSDFDATQWLLFDQSSDVAGNARGLAHSRVWTESGKLVATVAQEALLRAPSFVGSNP